MSKRRDCDLLKDIIESINRIISYTNDIEFNSFKNDFKTQDAVIRNIEVLGEAAKGISEELKQNTPDIPWKSMAATRDKLIHHYFGVNIDIIWDIVKNELPTVLPLVMKISQDTHSNYLHS